MARRHSHDVMPVSSSCSDNGDVAIAEGLKANDTIVVKGSYIMRSEFLKSLLGAGCVDD